MRLSFIIADRHVASQILTRRITLRYLSQNYKRNVYLSSCHLDRQSNSIRDDLNALNEMQFPCLEKNENLIKKSYQKQKSERDSKNKYLNESCSRNPGNGPDPSYSKISGGYKIYKSNKPMFLDYGNFLPDYSIAYETWGKLNKDKSNAILLHTGLSASSHARSHLPDPGDEKNETNFEFNYKAGWWENFIGPGNPIDTNKYFVICTNVLGGCYGSTGPSSFTDSSESERYCTKFPVISVSDMVRVQHDLVKSHLGISKLHASVGSSLGAMQSLAYVNEFTDEVEKVVSISGCVRSHPSSIAMRFAQRQIVMNDSNWKKGYYYNNNNYSCNVGPVMGMKLAREVATITYRSGPEWESRFSRIRASENSKPMLCADFLVETYLDHQGDKFSLEFDANSFLYISKAMDLFDLGFRNRNRASIARKQVEQMFNRGDLSDIENLEFNHNYVEQKITRENLKLYQKLTPEESKHDIMKGLEKISHKNILIIGVKSDILFPCWQQKEAYEILSKNQELKNLSNDNLRYVELGEEVSQYGHDTFLLDTKNIGDPINEFLQ